MNARFRKKFGLACALSVVGSYIAIATGASVLEFTGFASAMLAIFGGADLIDKGKVGGKIGNEAAQDS